MSTPIIASRTTALVSETKKVESPRQAQDPRRLGGFNYLTFGDFMVAGLSVLALVFAVVGVLIAVT
ncbi:MAG: hypothetical protein AB3N23_00495 [Paracoccaceae bacterium]